MKVFTWTSMAGRKWMLSTVNRARLQVWVYEPTFWSFDEFDLDDGLQHWPAAPHIQPHNRTCNLQGFYRFTVRNLWHVCVIHPQDAVVHSGSVNEWWSLLIVIIKRKAALTLFHSSKTASMCKCVQGRCTAATWGKVVRVRFNLKLQNWQCCAFYTLFMCIYVCNVWQRDKLG